MYRKEGGIKMIEMLMKALIGLVIMAAIGKATNR
jgi:Tfp pilus assembly protein PilW